MQWDITLAPLNVCRYLTLTPDWFEALARCNPVGAFLRDVHVFYAGFYRTVMGVTSHVLVRTCRRQGTAAALPIDLSSPLLCPQAHDSCAVLAITHPHLFTEAARVCVDVECTGTVTLGVTVADLRGHVESRDDEEAGGDGSASPAARRRRTNVTVLLRAESDAARAAMVDLIGAYSR